MVPAHFAINISNTFQTFAFFRREQSPVRGHREWRPGGGGGQNGSSHGNIEKIQEYKIKQKKKRNV